MDVDNILTQLQTMAARGASGIATRGTAAGRLSVLAGTMVAPGHIVIDTVTGQPVEVVSVAVAYLPQGVIDAV